MTPDEHGASFLRRFGLKVSVALGLIALLRWWWAGAVPTVHFGIVGLILVSAIVAPRALRPLHRAFILLAEALNWLLTRVGLAVGFYLVVTPAALIYRLVAGDPLKRAWDKNAATYWEPADEQPDAAEAYKNQF